LSVFGAGFWSTGDNRLISAILLTARVFIYSQFDSGEIVWM
jgi:hypothetical protein